MSAAHKGVCCKANDHGDNAADPHVDRSRTTESTGDKGNYVATEEYAGAFKALHQGHGCGQVLALEAQPQISLQGGNANHNSQLAAAGGNIAGRDGRDKGRKHGTGAADGQGDRPIP